MTCHHLIILFSFFLSLKNDILTTIVLQSYWWEDVSHQWLHSFHWSSILYGMLLLTLSLFYRAKLIRVLMLCFLFFNPGFCDCHIYVFTVGLCFHCSIIITPEGTLIIRNISKPDEGKYTCFAENFMGKANSTGILSVRGKDKCFIFMGTNAIIMDRVVVHFVYRNFSLEKNTSLNYSLHSPMEPTRNHGISKILFPSKSGTWYQKTQPPCKFRRCVLPSYAYKWLSIKNYCFT